MDSNELPLMGPDVDLAQVPAIDQKRTIAFINHFLINTVTFLNKFSRTCETKFIDYERKIQKLEAALLILENKLSSIPGLDDLEPTVVTVSQVKVEPILEPPADLPVVTLVETNSTETIIESPNLGSEAKEPSTNTISGIKACMDARYVRFFKMLQFGVPPPAVKLKMNAEGYDPQILDEPNRIIPEGTLPAESNVEISDSD